MVSALTIPSLLHNIENKQYFAAYKKAYADGCNALERQSADFRYIKLLSDSDGSGNPQKNFLAFMSYFNVATECTKGSDYNKCWNENGEKLHRGMPNTSSLAFIDASGRAWIMAVGASDVILVDTNGMKGPNHFGKDRWAFMPVDENGARAVGTHKIAVALFPHFADVLTYDVNICRHPPCLYRSALFK